MWELQFTRWQRLRHEYNVGSVILSVWRWGNKASWEMSWVLRTSYCASVCLFSVGISLVAAVCSFRTTQKLHQTHCAKVYLVFLPCLSFSFLPMSSTPLITPCIHPFFFVMVLFPLNRSVSPVSPQVTSSRAAQQQQSQTGAGSGKKISFLLFSVLFCISQR